MTNLRQFRNPDKILPWSEVISKMQQKSIPLDVFLVERLCVLTGRRQALVDLALDTLSESAGQWNDAELVEQLNGKLCSSGMTNITNKLREYEAKVAISLDSDELLISRLREVAKESKMEALIPHANWPLEKHQYIHKLVKTSVIRPVLRHGAASRFYELTVRWLLCLSTQR